MKRRMFLTKLYEFGLFTFLKKPKVDLQIGKPILNVLLAIDLSQENRKKDRLADLRAMDFFFRSKGEMAGMNVQVHTFLNASFTPTHLIETINKIGDITKNQPQNSGIVFYFSGHGANFGDEIFPRFSFGNEVLAMNKLNAMIGACNPRLRFILADCCNNFIQGMSQIPNTANPTDEDLVKKLFWDFGASNVKKTILICAAERGEYSYSVESGSIFQQMFRKAFYECTSNDNINTSWEQIKNRTMKEVKRILDRQSKTTGINYGQSPIFTIISTSDI
ncbi:caspase family protein [Arcicella lustrica]|uniref:Caspase family protein n=1 Tax=Arcicella lustrica TaxID=2984196 RepID=A0ABU5SK47_9BACT|nr:caspase family protein [Arcicella sp. DC25W]MEA5427620.1 caspase family protein [Arcicella sp. DC25W]